MEIGENNRSTALSLIVGIFAACCIALSAPLSYLFIQAERLLNSAHSSAMYKAKSITELATVNPATWFFEERKLQGILENKLENGQLEHSYLTDMQSTVLAENAEDLPWPLISVQATVYDAGDPIGYVHVSYSFSKPLWHGTFLLIVGLAGGWTAYFLLRIRPMRDLKFAYKNLHAIHESLYEEKERIQVTFQSIGDAVITTDSRMIIEYINPVAEHLTGWTAAEAKGLHMDNVFKIYNEMSRASVVNPIVECLTENKIVKMENHTILVRRSDQKEFHIEDSAAPIRRADGSIIGAVMVFHDVTDKKRAQNQLQHIAFHDTLTGLPNRALFRKKLLKSMADARLMQKHAAVIFMDLDRFKSINDSLGHGAGDELLILVSKRLKQCVRDSDVVCRMGGDEFTAVLSSISEPQSVSVIAEKIINSIAQPFNISGREIRISTSIGIALYPDDSEDLDDLLINADTAMYHAKSQGRGNYQYFTQSMRPAALGHLQMKQALDAALDNSEYFLEYQPKFDVSGNTIVGGEALLRWQSSDFGRVMPNEFISKLEESGAIVSVGNWVLQNAICQARQWADAGHAIVVSVNVSARQFRQEGLVQQIASMLKANALPPSLLQIEITESLLMDDAERSGNIMRQLIDIGVNISLDDFGTGYSSLSYLRRFPINELKIDRSFVHDLGTDETANKIVKTVIDLGQALGMKVTAEGVETEVQRLQLKKLGCNEIQGYLLSRPLKKDAFDDLLMKLGCTAV